MLAVNVLALATLVAGVLYLGGYRRGLIAAEIDSLFIQGEMFAAALGETAVAANTPSGQELEPGTVLPMVRRLVGATGVRARLFAPDGVLMADSRLLTGPGGAVQVEDLPPPEEPWTLGTALEIYGQIAEFLAGELPASYRERATQRANDYVEVMRALAGERAQAVRAATTGKGLVLGVAVPVQRYKQVLGALFLTKDSLEIDAALLEVRMAVLQVFAVSLGVTFLLSLYLAGTIARPVRILAAAAERVHRSHARRHTIPEFRGRRDEIGVLARSLREMTSALWQRMDAIERFAADVAHEIKNPLTSLQSAVETVARVRDPAQRDKLMAIIEEDVRRLDRLITDISEASRLDAELSRAETEPVDVGAMLAVLVDMQACTGNGGARLVLECMEGADLTVQGMEGRLVQVFRNLIANALSFSPGEGTITLGVSASAGWLQATVEDEGPGIPAGKEEAIFERFYTERPPSEKFGTHSGLGLSISRQIVEALGGTLKAENRPQGGARFIVRLPQGG